ncbi:unnamed protein product [Adineta steineri]|uniref:Arrestin C-terminal-like domain-containing protein n=1 Tax=Adineta steineri TaxID=433720 RepID=A0A814QK36_9BILA|nr:unnamed protein product [Adineta steineri]CAF4128791.1 unnamed protein product [Adineta steineri]
MGCGASSTIIITLDRTNSLFFSDEIISGTVQLHIKDKKLCADQIDLNLIGEVGYTTTHTSSVNGQATTSTTYHHIPFLKTKHVLACAQAEGEELTYTQDQNLWSFQFKLPDYLPPSLCTPQQYPHVRYYLQVLIEKPWYKRNIRENRYITVFPSVNLLAQQQCLTGSTFGNHNRKDIILKGTLSKTGYVPGESILITIEIENPRGVLIKQINLSMIQSYEIEGRSRDIIVTSCTVPGIIDRKDERIVQTFDASIPAVPLAPSYQFRGGIKELALVNVKYIWKFEVKVEGMFTNFETMIPIIIGTEPYTNQP